LVCAVEDRDGVHRAGLAVANPFVESFHSRVRDELLDVEEFACLAEARVVIGDWREDYNWRRPHSSLGMKAPAEFAAAWVAEDRAPLAA
jgi:putative transposase